MAITTQHNATLEYLVSDGIGTAHCFTTRRGGVSTGSLDSLNLGIHRGDTMENIRENYGILARALGIPKENMVLTMQVHSDIVRTVTKADHAGFDTHDYPNCDALITSDPGTALVVFAADCTPILLWDSITGAVGAIHAGWRGTAANIAGKTVAKMAAEFGCQPGNLRAAIGPNIGHCCFQTDGEVPQALLEAYGPEIAPMIRAEHGKFYPDLKKINALALTRAGVPVVDISTDCTVCQNTRFWSHRVHGALRGSQGAIIVCQEGQK